MNYSIGQLVKKTGLSRTALLYYDSISLLNPSGRSPAGYRIYHEEDLQRLEEIMMLRETGMPLKEIAKVIESLFESGIHPISSSLVKRLGELNDEISACRRQQKLILEMIKKTGTFKNIRNANPSVWSRLLKESGIDQNNTKQWHSDFERYSPEEHHEFLKSIGFSEDEAREVRDWSSKK